MSRRDWIAILGTAVIGCMVVIVVACLHGCAPAAQQLTPAEKKEAAEKAYGAALLKCVADNPTRAESDKCQTDVDARWHVTLRADGGT